MAARQPDLADDVFLASTTRMGRQVMFSCCPRDIVPAVPSAWLSSRHRQIWWPWVLFPEEALEVEVSPAASQGSLYSWGKFHAASMLVACLAPLPSDSWVPQALSL